MSMPVCYKRLRKAMAHLSGPLIAVEKLWITGPRGSVRQAFTLHGRNSHTGPPALSLVHCPTTAHKLSAAVGSLSCASKASRFRDQPRAFEWHPFVLNLMLQRGDRQRFITATMPWNAILCQESEADSSEDGYCQNGRKDRRKSRPPLTRISHRVCRRVAEVMIAQTLAPIGCVDEESRVFRPARRFWSEARTHKRATGSVSVDTLRIASAEDAASNQKATAGRRTLVGSGG